jgi:hypothetical protein
LGLIWFFTVTSSVRETKATITAMIASDWNSGNEGVGVTCSVDDGVTLSVGFVVWLGLEEDVGFEVGVGVRVAANGFNVITTLWLLW